jgi:Arc/MetJ family transcription regulator
MNYIVPVLQLTLDEAFIERVFTELKIPMKFTDVELLLKREVATIIGRYYSTRNLAINTHRDGTNYTNIDVFEDKVVSLERILKNHSSIRKLIMALLDLQ